MTCKLLYLPVCLWLLLPPGLCLNTLNQIWGLAPVCDPTIPAIDDGDAGHSPSCPCKKSGFTTRSGADAAAPAALPFLALDTARAASRTELPAGVELLPPPPSLTNTSDLYLTLRTLRI